MLSTFQSAGELLDSECPIRSVIIPSGDPNLPSGEYTFLDTYCTDNTCDCRKTIIQIFHDEQLVSIVSFGWESPKFYLRWMKSSRSKRLAKGMSGLTIDFSSPNRVSTEGILILVNQLLDEKWIAILKENYRRIREYSKPDNVIRLLPKISRNAPCSCGSGKKYKHCCL